MAAAGLRPLGQVRAPVDETVGISRSSHKIKATIGIIWKVRGEKEGVIGFLNTGPVGRGSGKCEVAKERGRHTVEDGVATIEREFVLELLLPLGTIRVLCDSPNKTEKGSVSCNYNYATHCRATQSRSSRPTTPRLQKENKRNLITHPTIRDPPIRLHQRRRSQILVLVPPVARTTRATARTQNALVHPVELAPVLLRLEELALGGRVVVLQVGLDGFVLFVEEGQVGDEVLDDVHWRTRVSNRTCY